MKRSRGRSALQQEQGDGRCRCHLELSTPPVAFGVCGDADGSNSRSCACEWWRGADQTADVKGARNATIREMHR